LLVSYYACTYDTMVWIPLCIEIYYKESKVPVYPSGTLDELKEFIEEEWNDTSVDFLSELVESMPRRCAAVVAAKGALIDY
jgi:predicted GTPase